MVESLQAWGFALRATTPQVAFGCDPTGRSVFYKKDRSTQKNSRQAEYSIRSSMLDVRPARNALKPVAALTLRVGSKPKAKTQTLN